jgi:hypothetical protein
MLLKQNIYHDHENLSPRILLANIKSFDIKVTLLA